MRLLTWFLGILVCTLGVELARWAGDGWQFAWWFLMGIWCFVGLGVLLSVIVRKALTGRGLGTGRPLTPRPPVQPDTHTGG